MNPNADNTLRGSPDSWIPLADAAKVIGCTVAKLQRAMRGGMPTVKTTVADWTALVHVDLAAEWVAGDQDTGPFTRAWRAWRPAVTAANPRTRTPAPELYP